MNNYKIIYQNKNYSFNELDFKEFMLNRLKLTGNEIISLLQANCVTLSNGEKVILVSEFPVPLVANKPFKLFRSVY